MSKFIVQQLQQQFPEAVVETQDFRGDETVVVHRARLVELCRWVQATPALDMNMMMDLCGVDYPGRAERFEVVYHLYSTTKHHRIRLKVRLPETDPVVDSVTGVWVAANWFERECFDLFGVQFRGHPQLTRLLTFEEFQGHPLRKDYPVNRRPAIPSPDPLLIRN